MADINGPGSTAANKPKESKRKRLLGLFKRSNPSASQANSTSVPVPSTSSAHHPGPGNDAESAEPTDSGDNGSLHPHHTAPFQSSRSPSPSLPDRLGSGVGRGHGGETNRTSTLTAQVEPPLTNPQTQVPDWKATAKEGLGVASRFAQTLLKRVPECIDVNPVKMAFAIAKVVIEIKDAIGDNKDQLAQHLERTANRLLAVERTVVSGVPKAAEQAMEKLKQTLGEEMKELMGLTNKSLATRILDYEEYKAKIQQIFLRVEEATASFHVEMAVSIQNTASQIHDDIKEAAMGRLRPSAKADHKTLLEDQALKREQCAAGTRVKILEDITKWANDTSSGSPRVFWLTGQAGSGKTTIAYTIAKLFEKGGKEDQQTVLGGNFLCSRQFAETRERARIIPTIAYQLARKCKSYADALHVAGNFDAVNHDVSAQLEGLLVGPWQQSGATRSPELSPYLIVIDALDEIKDDGGSAFLQDLFTAIGEYDLKGFKFLVTSRSDPELVTLFESFESKADRWLQHVPIEEALLDIGTYLRTKLPKLASSPELAELGQRTGGLFISAATAVKYLTPHRSITPREQTKMLGNLLSNSHKLASASNATSLIDELYRQIMHDTFSRYEGEYLTCRLRILYTFLCTAERASTSIVAALVEEEDDDTARAVAGDLHAVLYIQDNRVFWYHASFPDFIFNPARSNFRLGEDNFTFWCNEPAHHNLLGESCFRVMESGLRFNLGDITSSFLFDSDNTDMLSKKVQSNISAVLRYSSRHWTHHLPSTQSIDTDNLRRCISGFLRIRVLFWIEAMNLLGLCNQCTPMLQRARQWVLKCGNGYSGLARDVGEAANFATYFAGSPAAKSTPHLYISALATWSQDSSLCWDWKKQFAHIPIFAHAKGEIDLPLMTVSATSGVNAVAFSSDGTRIVSGLSDGSVVMWDASTGAELNTLKGHTGGISSVAFSGDGTQVVSGSDDQCVRVWDASKGVELKVLGGYMGPVNSVAFSSDGTRIVSGSYDESVRVWDVSKGTELKMLKGHTKPVTSVAFSSDGTWIVSGSLDASMRVWDVSEGAELKMLKGHTGPVTSVAFSGDSTQIISGSHDQSVRVWDVSKAVELKILKGHTDWVTSVAFSSDGTRIVSGSADKSVRLWDVSEGAELKILEGHTGSVTTVAFSSDSTRIVSGSYDQSLRVWGASKGAELNTLKGHTGSVTSIAFSSEGMQIVSGSTDRSVRVWDASTGAELNVLKGHATRVTSVAISNDGRQIVSGSADQSVRVWDTLGVAEPRVLEGHTDTVNSVVFSSDATRIVSGSVDQSVRVWDVSKGVELKVLLGHTDLVTSVAFSSDGTWIVSGSDDHSVRVWDASTGAELKMLKGHTTSVASVAISNDGGQIVSGSYDHSVRVWDALTGVELNVLKGHARPVTSVGFSSDGTRIVSGSFDKSVRVWDVSKGAELSVLEGHTGSVTSVMFSIDGTRIVSGSRDESVRVWDVSKGAELNVLKGRTGGVSSGMPSSDGTQTFTGLDEFVKFSGVGCAHVVWNCTETNWIVSRQGQNRLMWVPQEAEVREPSNILIISRHGSGSVDFTQSMIGVEWVGCYTP